MRQRREASVLGDIPSVWVGDLYQRGEPQQDNGVVCETTGPDGVVFKFSFIPETHCVRVDTNFREPFSFQWDRFEPTAADVEWIEWSFNSRRPYILCQRCLRRVLRAFIVTGGLQAYLYCRGCARIRFRSQDAPFIDRVSTRIDQVRTLLGGSPTFGIVGKPLPARPKGMWTKTYWNLSMEVRILEGLLSQEYETNARAMLADAYDSFEKTQAQIDSWTAIAGPYAPKSRRGKRRKRAS